jgi:hypothetical protein
VNKNKGDRFWDRWMERIDRNAGIRHGKEAIALSEKAKWQYFSPASDGRIRFN